jgi:hypothetical protein
VTARSGYWTGYNTVSPAPDLGHTWTVIAPHWDGAQCTTCGLEASNASIASANTGHCPRNMTNKGRRIHLGQPRKQT